MAIEWGESSQKDEIFAPTLHSFILFHSCPVLHDSENFLTSSLLLGAPQSPVPPRKTLLLVNLPTTIAFVFNRTYFVTKNILEIKNKFISSNQTNF